METNQPASLLTMALLPALKAESKALEKSVKGGQLPAIAKSVERVVHLLNVLNQHQLPLSPELKQRVNQIQKEVSSAIENSGVQTMPQLNQLTEDVSQELSDKRLIQLQPMELMLKMALASLENRHKDGSVIAVHIITKRLNQSNLDPSIHSQLRQAIDLFKKSLEESPENCHLRMRIADLEVNQLMIQLIKLSDEQATGMNWAA